MVNTMIESNNSEEFKKESKRTIKVYKEGEKQYLPPPRDTIERMGDNTVTIRAKQEKEADFYHWGREELLEYRGVIRHFRISHEALGISELLVETKRLPEEDWEAVDAAVCAFFEKCIAYKKGEIKIPDEFAETPETDGEGYLIKKIGGEQEEDEENVILKFPASFHHYALNYGGWVYSITPMIGIKMENRALDMCAVEFFNTFMSERNMLHK